MESLALENQTPVTQEVMTKVEVSPVVETQPNTTEVVEVVEISAPSVSGTSEDNKTVSEGQAEAKKETEGEKEVKASTSPTKEKKEVDPVKVKNLMTHIKAMMGMQYMRTDGVAAEILPGFYLGSIGAAFNRKILQEQNVGHILCCCDNVKEAFPNVFKYRMLKLLDKPDEDITRYFDETAEYIHEILTKGEKVLVHCFAGKSRSTTIMISYLIKYQKMTVDQALKAIREKRPVAQPNMGFLKQLRLYEKKILESGAPEVQAEASA